MAQPAGYGNLVGFSRTGAGITGAGTVVVGSQYVSEVLTLAQPNLPFLPFAQQNFAPDKKQGETLVWNIAGDLGAGGQLTAGTPIPFNNFAIKQVSAQVNEYGNAVSWDGAWDEFFSYSNNAILMRKQLGNDFAKVLNTGFLGEANAFGTTICALAIGSVSINPTSAGSSLGSVILGTFHVHEVRRQLEANNVPRFAGDYYVWVIHPSTFEGLRRSAGFETAMINANLRGLDNPVINGAYGMYDGFLFVPSTTLTSTTSINGGTSFAFGDGAFGLGHMLPGLMDFRYENDYLTDFGRMKGVAWWSLLSFPNMYTGLLSGVPGRGYRISTLDL